MNVLLASSVYLPYTMSWIYRQVAGYDKGKILVICQKRQNEDLFPHSEVILFSRDSFFFRFYRSILEHIFKNKLVRFSAAKQAHIKHVVQKNDIRLIHVHFGTHAIFYYRVAELLRIPLIVTFHGHDISSSFGRWPAYKKEFPKLLSLIKYAIVISEEMKERLVALGCPEEKVLVSYLGVPVDQFPFFDRSSRNSIVKYVHAGRLTAKKGVVDLVKAFQIAFPNPGKAELLIAGDGEERDNVKEIIHSLGLETHVRMLGKLSNEELVNLRNEADVFVLNCRTDSAGTKEGLPIATLEAASTGLPVISTYHAGIPESINHGETGLLVNEYDNHSLAQAMLSLYDKDFRLGMGLKARKFMEDKFDLSKCNQFLYDIYQKSVI
jgi:colanic acid/amylovoran biosynthesis glycosyltransferase